MLLSSLPPPKFGLRSNNGKGTQSCPSIENWIKDNFSTKTVAVEGANDYEAIDYTVFVAENAAGMAATKYTVTIA